MRLFQIRIIAEVYNNKLSPGLNLYEEPMLSESEQLKVGTRGAITGYRVMAIADMDDLSSNYWSTKAIFYNKQKRVAQVLDENYNGVTNINTTLYDFLGQLLSNYSVHKNPLNNEPLLQTISTSTNILYDHAGRVLELRKEFNEHTGNDIGGDRVVFRNEYDGTGTLIKKKVGGIPEAVSNYPGNVNLYLSDYSELPVEELNYEYNVRGWLKSINKNYANGSGDNWFGLELSYDWGFDKNQLTGSPAGVKWRSAGDHQMRAYGYGYDILNRLQFADFSQESGGNYVDDGVINFDMQIGELSNNQWVNSYDENGNILKLKQWGTKINSSSVIDDLSYNYNSKSNKLQNVIDLVNDPQTILGDFRSSESYMHQLRDRKMNNAVDYSYDANGNITKDLNKDIVDQNDPNIQAILYNHLNLPYKITIKDKGVINYIYDADGVKLEKIVTPISTSIPSKIQYSNGFVYKDNNLQFFGQEEGRVRVELKDGIPLFFFDYFIKDNLGNIRVVLTDEKKQDTYPIATFEDGAIDAENEGEGKFYQINSANIVDKSSIPNFNNNPENDYYNNNGNPPYNPNPLSDVDALSQKLYKLNGSNGDKIGLGITLKVMTGDLVDIFGKSYYHLDLQTAVSNNNPITNTLANFINAFATTSGVVNSGKNATPSILNNSVATTNGLTDWLNNDVPTPPGNVPRAYINWILFDEQFRPVANGSGFDPVNVNSDLTKNHFNTVNINQSGYLYVYCSNESNINVYFDNLQVIHTIGPLLETNEYYPYGLLAAGISYKASGGVDNNYKLSGNELQSKEFEDGAGLELYDFNARMYDPQIGRFQSQDPLAVQMPEWSPYSFSFNNPVNFIDPMGLEPYDYEEDDDYGGDGENGPADWLPIHFLKGFFDNFRNYSEERDEKEKVPNIQGFREGDSPENRDNEDFGLDLDNFEIRNVNFEFTSEQAQDGGPENFSLSNMYIHFQVGGGKPMTLNMSSVDFGRATQKVLGLTGMRSGDVRPVNLFKAGPTNPAALAFGNVNIMYHGNNQFSIVSDRSSRFDFSPLVGGSSLKRDAGNVLGFMVNYNLLPGTPSSPLVPLIFGGPYDVNFIGTTTIPR